MNDSAKTSVFVAVAVVILFAAWVTKPKPYSVDLSQQLGTFLNDGDPLEAASLEIVKFDEATGEAKPFKVAEVNGVWSLPSRLNYPADAENQMADAAASVMHLQVLNVVDIQPADYATYGVIDPSKAKPGDTGVGIRVKIEKADGSKIAEFVIGKQDQKQTENRYVRLPGQDVVYLVPLDTGKLSTRFEDWIEDDLLKFNALDIRQVALNNYSFDEVNGRIKQGDILNLTYNEKDSKWTLAGLKQSEELNQEPLNAMKQALDDLKIIDVRRKPEGLSQELRSEQGIRLDQQAMVSLAQHGFYITRDGQLISNEGEVVARMKDGVEYILRFGEIAETDEDDGDGAEADAKKSAAGASKPADEKAKDEKSKGSSRYIFVMARFNPDMIAKPELTPLPAEPKPAAAEKPPTKAETSPPPEKNQPEKTEPEKKSDTKKDPTPKPPKTSPAPAEDAENSGGDDTPKQEETPKKTAPKEPATATEPATESPATDAAAAKKPPAASNDQAAGKDKPDKAKDKLQRIKDENQRKQDEYQEKLKKGQERVKKLNDRFADWYYIISNSVFEKIHLSRAQVIKAPEKKAAAEKAEGETLEGLEKLKQQGPGGGAN